MDLKLASQVIIPIVTLVLGHLLTLNVHRQTWRRQWNDRLIDSQLTHLLELVEVLNRQHKVVKRTLATADGVTTPPDPVAAATTRADFDRVMSRGGLLSSTQTQNAVAAYDLAWSDIVNVINALGASADKASARALRDKLADLDARLDAARVDVLNAANAQVNQVNGHVARQGFTVLDRLLRRRPPVATPL